ncbi:uncharacterized protein LOC142041229 isoform X1 [Buteo buteo]|uniref:uncharacterized protein LOC142041229 isoform X1 n=1 Tax=Buteo buteo TaxID=30397 RepID=UPI003EB73A54
MQRKALTGERPVGAEQLHGPRAGAWHSRDGGAPSLPISRWCPQHLGKTVPACSSSCWNCVVARCLEKNSQELQRLERQMAQMKKHLEMAKRDAAASLEVAQKVPFPAHGSLRRPALARQREQWSEAVEALQEEAQINELLRNKLQHLLERQQGLQEPTAFRGKTAAQADVAGKSLLQEVVDVRLEEQLASRRHKIASWLRRFLLFLAFLQIILLLLVFLKRDILDGVLPPKLTDAFGSCPGRSPFS